MALQGGRGRQHCLTLRLSRAHTHTRSFTRTDAHTRCHARSCAMQLRVAPPDSPGAAFTHSAAAGCRSRRWRRPVVRTRYLVITSSLSDSDGRWTHARRSQLRDVLHCFAPFSIRPACFFCSALFLATATKTAIMLDRVIFYIAHNVFHLCGGGNDIFEPPAVREKLQVADVYFLFFIYFYIFMLWLLLSSHRLRDGSGQTY